MFICMHCGIQMMNQRQIYDHTGRLKGPYCDDCANELSVDILTKKLEIMEILGKACWSKISETGVNVHR